MISVIIPTHNRCDQVKKLLENIDELKNEIKLEVILVDNNSSDETYKVVNEFNFIKYIFEKNTAFTRARLTGALNSSYEILLFLDDDVIVGKNSFKEIINIFHNDKNCGLIAGRIDPYYLNKPPEWVLKCQNEFNGWSLFHKGEKEKFVDGAAGPMIAIKKSLFFDVGGFEPDTIGVETNRKDGLFQKLYIGPGDYGLCYKVKLKGFKIKYSPLVRCQHIIPKNRMTISFWRSRLLGEGQVEAITDLKLYKKNKLDLFFKKSFYNFMFFLFLFRLKKEIYQDKNYFFSRNELWLKFFKSYLDCNNILKENTGLSDFLWKIATEGVPDENYQKIINKLPKQYLLINNVGYFYDDEPINKKNFNNKINFSGRVNFNLMYIAFGCVIFFMRFIKKFFLKL